VEAVALLDVLLSFAELVITSDNMGPWTRPTITAQGPLAIKRGR
jgi:DNA mismatch repair ATPase MutS